MPKFEVNRIKIVDSRVYKEILVKIQNGHQSAILYLIITKFELIRALLVINIMSKFEGNRLKIAASRVFTRMFWSKFKMAAR